MPFREQGKKIPCTRSIDDPARKRCPQKVAATMARSAEALASVRLPGLTDSECRVFARWFDECQSVCVSRASQLMASGGGPILVNLAQAIRAADRLSDAQLAAI